MKEKSLTMDKVFTLK